MTFFPQTGQKRLSGGRDSFCIGKDKIYVPRALLSCAASIKHPFLNECSALGACTIKSVLTLGTSQLRQCFRLPPVGVTLYCNKSLLGV